MAAYIIAEVEVTDPDSYATYRAQTPGVVERYSGRFIVRGGAAETLEGEGRPGRVVVLSSRTWPPPGASTPRPSTRRSSASATGRPPAASSWSRAIRRRPDRRWARSFIVLICTNVLC